MKYTIEIPLISRVQLTTSGSPGIPDGGVIHLFENRLVDDPSRFFSTANLLPVEDCMIRDSLLRASLREEYALIDQDGTCVYRFGNYTQDYDA
jgi:hypothetical protein